MLLFLVFVFGLLSACVPTAPEPLPTRVAFPPDVRDLAFWESVQGFLNDATDTDEYQFFGQAGDEIILRALPDQVMPSMVLRIGDAIVSSGTEIAVTLPATATYRVTVRSADGNAGRYDIGLRYADRENPNQPTPLPQVVGIPTPTLENARTGSYVQTLSGPAELTNRLDASSPQHIYALEGREGQFISVEMRRTSGTLDPQLTLFDPGGVVLATDDNSAGLTNARLLNVRLPQTGIYSVRVSGKDLFGDYLLRYIDSFEPYAPDPQPTLQPTTVPVYTVPTAAPARPEQVLDDHWPVTDEIGYATDFRRYTVFADQGDALSLAVVPQSGAMLRPQVQVFGPDGLLLSSATANRAGESAVIVGAPVRETGGYVVIVTAQDNTSGPFSIAYGSPLTVRDVFQGQVEALQRVAGTVRQSGDRHIWQVGLHAGDVVEVSAIPADTSFDPIVAIVRQDGQVIHFNNDGGGDRAALLASAAISDPGNYVLQVYDAAGNTGSYTLEWRYLTVAPTATPIPRTTTLLTVRDAIERDQYAFLAFQAQAGQQIRVNVTALETAPFDPVVAVLNAAGEVLAEADDSNNTLNPELTVPISQTGTYRLRINGYLSAGEFEAVVKLVFP